MGELKIMSTEELAKELTKLCKKKITKRQVLQNVKKRRWLPIEELGKRPYMFDLETIRGQLKASSLTTESRTANPNGKAVLHIPAKRRKGDTRRIWEK